jgi:DNA primase
VSLIPDEVIEQVKDATDILSLVGESVDLKRTGSDWRGCCPFHGGTHRNFAVIPRKGLFYCYVCHEAGDVFSYMIKRFGMDYPTAVRELARKAGIVVPDKQQRAGPDPNEPLYGAVASAAEWFAHRLLESADAGGARSYLEKREIALEVAAPHGLGYAPGGGAFMDAMRGLGIKDHALVDRASCSAMTGIHARFRDRLLFPIHDIRGRAVGFGGRLLGPGEPKYLNSPETPIYSKGRTLYGLNLTKSSMGKVGFAVLVEGYFDFAPTGARRDRSRGGTLGTAPHAESRPHSSSAWAPAAILLYDSDSAGSAPPSVRATNSCGMALACA